MSVIRKLGLGISETNIRKIPIGLVATSMPDDDEDGISTAEEQSIGINPNNADTDGDDISDYAEILGWTNPYGAGKWTIDKRIAQRLSGRIILEVQKHGEAWYVNPKDGRRYFLGGPAEAQDTFRQLGLTVRDSSIAGIPYNYSNMSYMATNFYTLHYPDNWTLAEQVVQDKTYSNIPVLQKVNVTSDTGAAILEISSLQTTSDRTLQDFKVSSLSGAQKTSTRNIIIGVKPALIQTFKYQSTTTVNNLTYTNGAVIYADVMFSTKKFVHMKFSILNGDDFEISNSIFDKILHDLTLIY